MFDFWPVYSGEQFRASWPSCLSYLPFDAFLCIFVEGREIRVHSHSSFDFILFKISGIVITDEDGDRKNGYHRLSVVSGNHQQTAIVLQQLSHAGRM